MLSWVDRVNLAAHLDIFTELADYHIRPGGILILTSVQQPQSPGWLDCGWLVLNSIENMIVPVDMTSGDS